jgi:hypothetical protein
VPISQEQFVRNYKVALEPHDERSKIIVEAYNVATKFTRELGGDFSRTARDINVITMPNEKIRYFTDDELIEMTTKEN